MRSKKAALNMTSSLINYTIIVLLNLIIRAVFSRTLGIAMVGVDTLMKSVMSMLSLAELGIGTGLMYKLYKPILNKDQKTIASILSFYKKAYRKISTAVLVSGLVLCLFVKKFVKEDYSSWFLAAILILYTLDTVASYLYAHKKALLTADQRSYIVFLFHALFQLLQAAAQLLILFYAKQKDIYLGFILFAAVKILFRIIEALAISRKFAIVYPEFSDFSFNLTLEKTERKSLVNNIKAMIMHKIRWFSVNMTSSMIISSFVGLAANGLYGNYTLITNTLFSLTDQLFNALCASFGDLMAQEKKGYVINRFNMLFFVNFLIYSFFTISTFSLIQPFMKLWIGVDAKTGQHLLFNQNTVIYLIIYFYIVGMRKSLNMVRDSAGAYRPDRYLMLFEAVLNILLSLILVTRYGVNGVLIANIISALVVSFWSTPRVVYKHVLKTSVLNYYKQFTIYTLITVGELLLTVFIISKFNFNDLPQLIINGIICIIVPNGLNILIFRKSQPFKDLMGIVKNFSFFKRRTQN